MANNETLGMAEKVVIGNAELWHGDCREVLPLLGKVEEVTPGVRQPGSDDV